MRFGSGSGSVAPRAIGFAQRGGKVAGADRNAESANQVAAEITADIANPRDIDAMVASVSRSPRRRS
jgi:saccharopine dehydrogenase-like NADP-dependent oxidoreductase